MSEVVLTGSNFKAEVLESSVPVLVDFWATWCGPCRMLSPIIDEIARKYEGKLKVGKVNVDEEQLLAGQFRISAIPTVILFKGGQAVSSFMGYQDQTAVEAFIKNYI